MDHDSSVILLVEDEPAHAEIVQRTMLDSSVTSRLMHVPDGRSALDYLYRRGEFSAPGLSPRPNLMLLDLRLPKIDGLEVLKIVKSDADLSSIPVVVLTTSDSKEDKELAYTHHANGYLVKPLDVIRFVNLLEIHGDYWLSWNRNAFIS
jgi:CheY-like chemotaxis protein